AATERAYNQIQRLGNPLVSEVFLAKRSHPVHGATGPAQDVTLISAELKAFVANVAGRNATVQNTLAAVLLPDGLIIQTDKDPASAGWLSWALANGWGGRAESQVYPRTRTDHRLVGGGGGGGRCPLPPRHCARDGRLPRARRRRVPPRRGHCVLCGARCGRLDRGGGPGATCGALPPAGSRDG